MKRFTVDIGGVGRHIDTTLLRDIGTLLNFAEEDERDGHLGNAHTRRKWARERIEHMRPLLPSIDARITSTEVKKP